MSENVRRDENSIENVLARLRCMSTRWMRDVKEIERCNQIIVKRCDRTDCSAKEIERGDWEMWRRLRDVKEEWEMWRRCEGDEWEMCERWEGDGWEMSERCVRDDVRDPFYHSEHTVASTHFTAMWLQNNIQVLFCYFLGFNHSIRIVNTLLLVLISLHCSCRTAFKCHIFCWLIVHVCDLSFQWEVGFVSLQKSLLKVTSLLYTDDTANASINMSNQGQTSNCSCRISTDTC